MAGTPARVGIVGCGDVTELYQPYFEVFEAFEVVTCSDLDAGRSAALAGQCGIDACDTDTLLARPDVDIVLNLTPPAIHARISLAAIAAGKHVYSEKPLGVDREEARAILDAAARAGVRVGCAPDTFLGGSYQTARALIDEGAIGTVVGANAAFLALGPEYWHPNPGIFYGRGGGPMLDMGPYYVTCLLGLLGPVAAVSAVARGGSGSRLIREGDHAGESFAVTVPTYTIAGLEFASGAIAGVTVSFDTVASKSPDLEVHGTDGSLSLPYPNDFHGPVLLRRSGEDDWTEIPLRYDDTIGRGIGLADMATAIASGRPHRASGELAFHALDVMLAAGEAAAAGHRVDIASRCDRPAILPLGLERGRLDR